jgi:hypothetical protein
MMPLNASGQVRVLQLLLYEEVPDRSMSRMGVASGLADTAGDRAELSLVTNKASLTTPTFR